MELVIRRKDLIKLGREVIKEVYELFKDDYYIKTYPKKTTETLDKFYYYLNQSQFCFYKKSNYEKDLESVKIMIKYDLLDIKIIYETLHNLELDRELNEDLYFKIKAFLNLYSVFDIDYIYLEG